MSVPLAVRLRTAIIPRRPGQMAATRQGIGEMVLKVSADAILLLPLKGLAARGRSIDSNEPDQAGDCQVYYVHTKARQQP